MKHTTSVNGTESYDFGKACSQEPINNQSWWTEVSEYLAQNGFILLEETGVGRPLIAYLDKAGNSTLVGSVRSIANTDLFPYLTIHSIDSLALGVPKLALQSDWGIPPRLPKLQADKIAEGLSGILQKHIH